jgi:DNA-binding MarR family transcriptional regulator
MPTTTLAPDTLASLERALFRVARTVAGLRIAFFAQGIPCDRAGLAILGILESSGEPRLSDLAAALGVDLSTVSRQVRHLELAGLVARRSDPADGRASRVALTGRGSAVLTEVRDKRRALLADALQAWSSADREQLSQLLGRLAEDLGPDPSSRIPNRKDSR